MATLAVAGQSDSITFHPLGRFSIDTTIQPKYDTIPIIYLYSDTAANRVTDSMSWINYNVKWDFGYEVRQEKGIIPVTSSENSMMYDWLMSYKFIGYLDRQKNPIRKGVIIWITKTIEK